MSIFAIASIFKVNNHSSSNYARHSIYKIRVAFYTISLKNGGVERVTSILLNYLSKKKYFILYLITYKPRLNDEYPLSNNIIRISLSNHKRNLFKEIKKEKIDILIYILIILHIFFGYFIISTILSKVYIWNTKIANMFFL